MGTAASLLEDKRALGVDGVIAVHRDASALDAAILMNEHRVGAVVVVDYAGRVVGMFTERDVLTRIVAARRDPQQTFVDQAMTPDPVTCTPRTPIEDLRRVMKERRVRHVPVVDEEGVAIGLVSIGDLNAHSARELHDTVVYLEEYISRG